MYTKLYINKLINKALAVFISIACMTGVFTLSGCAKNGGNDGNAILLGSPVSIVIVDEKFAYGTRNYDKLNESICDLATEFNATFSVEGNSEISAYNTVIGQKRIETSKRLYDALTLSKSIYASTNGTFNPQTKHLVDLWGFSKRYREAVYEKQAPYDRERLDGYAFPLPDDRYVEAFITLSDFSKTELTAEGDNFYIVKPSLSVEVDGKTYYSALDLSGIAKGIFIDEAVRVINAAGVKSYYISAGGSSTYLSDNLGESWNLRIVDPFSDDRSVLLSVKIKNKYVSTSGTYENNYAFQGKTYSHVIDGKLGAPTDSDLVSATVIGDNGGKTDALSTALIVMGSEKALAYLSEQDGISYVLIKSNGEILSDLDYELA